MLKGEYFNKVIANVKERIKQIEKSLPEGVVIEPFIRQDRISKQNHWYSKKELA